MSDTAAPVSKTYCRCCKSENCCGRAIKKEFTDWCFKMVTYIACWFKRTFPTAFNKMLEGVAEKDDECRQTFASIFCLSDRELPWKQDTGEETTQKREFEPNTYTGGLSEEEQTAKAMKESLKEQNEANPLAPKPPSAPPSEPPPYSSLYSEESWIPAAYVPTAPPTAETDEVLRQRRLYPQL